MGGLLAAGQARHAAHMYTDLPEACRELLDLQHGVIARWQAPSVGLPPHVIDTRLRQGRWQSLYRGSYAAFTGPPPRTSILWAAALRGGPDAVLSHQTAAGVDGLTDKITGPIHLTIRASQRLNITAAERHRAVPGLRIHRSARLAVARHPLRTPPRTRIEETALDLVDQSTTLDEAMAWLSSACGRRLTTAEILRDALAERARMRWRPLLSEILNDITDGAHSALENRYVRDAERAHRLPVAIRQDKALRNQRAQYRDNLYKKYRLIVELDGQLAHPGSGRWSDIRRDNANVISGVLTLRYSWTDLITRPCSVAAEVAVVLQSRGWAGQPAACGPQCPAPGMITEACQE
jgi:very-short-patch-repair endonuclease